MPFIILLLFSALSVSTVAGWFSIVGLMAIFPGNAVPILTMGVVLEVAKLVTASWLYRNWSTAKVLIKSYFTVAVVVLSLITSMGIYGFLSKAHLEQTINVQGGVSISIAEVERQIGVLEKQVQDSEEVLVILDADVQTLQSYDRIRGPEGAIAVRASQKEERAELNAAIQAATEEMSPLYTELRRLQVQETGQKAELGPITYIAELIYGDAGQEVLDKAVRLVVILIVLVFDPLAILLVIAANMSWMQRKGEQVTFLDESALTKEEPSFNIAAVDEEEIIEAPKDTEDLSSDDNELLKKVASGTSLNPSDRKRLKDLTWLIDSKNKGA